MRKKQKPIKVRSWGAVAAHFKTGAGSHGGGAKTNNRRDRKRAKQELREEL
jgi:hypothetical protein